MHSVPLITQEFKENFSKFSSPSPNNNSQLELEARFGFFENGHFNSKLFDVKFYRNVKRHLDKLYQRHPNDITREEVSRIVQYNSNSVRKIIDKTGKIQYQLKYKDAIYDNIEWGIRFARSFEYNVDSDQHFIPIYQRQYHRIIYTDNRPKSSFYGFRIELSKVFINDMIHYELELESISNYKHTIEQWWASMQTLYGWMLDALDIHQIISINEQIQISNTINQILNNNVDNGVLKTPVNRPRVVTHLNQLSNKIMSLKLDGEHRIIYLCYTGIYVYSFPMNVTKIGIGSYPNTIIECEYLANMNTYFMFDIIQYNNNLIRNLSFQDRLNYLMLISKEIQLDHDKLTVKNFYTPNDIQSLEYDYKNTVLPVDGLIFQSPNSYIEPIYKWKPIDKLTLDFWLETVSTNPTVWCPYIIKTGKLEKFNFEQNKVVSAHIQPEYLHRKIVECQWNFNRNYWEPVRIRNDKTHPNSLHVANCTINMLQKKITLEQISQYIQKQINYI